MAVIRIKTTHFSWVVYYMYQTSFKHFVCVNKFHKNPIEQVLLSPPAPILLMRELRQK